MDYTNLKQALIDNYHSKGLSNCLGSVEKVVDELFDGLEEDTNEATDEEIAAAFTGMQQSQFTEEEIAKIVDDLPPLFTEEEIAAAFTNFDSEVD